MYHLATMAAAASVRRQRRQQQRAGEPQLCSLGMQCLLTAAAGEGERERPFVVSGQPCSSGHEVVEEAVFSFTPVCLQANQPVAQAQGFSVLYIALRTPVAEEEDWIG